MKNQSLRFFTKLLILFLLLNSNPQIKNNAFCSSRVKHSFFESGIPYLKNYSPKAYNADIQNWAIVQDQNGIMYFGNNFGVLVYDGVTWRLIKTANKSAVRSLAIDENGRIYVGAEAEFGYLTPDSIGHLNYVSLLSQLEDPDCQFADVWRTHCTPDGVYFQTFKYLFRWQEKKSNETLKNQGHLRIWPSSTMFYLPVVINDQYYLFERKVGMKTVLNDSLYLVPQGDEIANNIKSAIYIMLPFERASPSPNENIQPNISQSNIHLKSPVLLGSYKKGLFLYDGQALQPFKTEADSFLMANQIYHGATLQNGTFALATRLGGVAIIDKAGNLRQILNKANGLRDESVKFVYQDKQGGLWLALNNGIARVEISNPFRLFTEKLGVTSTIEHITRHQEKIYAATGMGVLCLPGSNISIYNNFQQTTVTKTQVFPLLSSEKSLLAATISGIYEIQNNRAKRLCEDVSLSLYQSKFDSNSVYVGLREGLGFLQKIDGHWVYQGTFPNIYEEVRYIAEEKENVLWLGTIFQGVLRIEVPDSHSNSSPLSTLNIERFGKKNGLSESFNYVYEINKHVVIATEKGVKYFDPSKQMFLPDTTLGPVLSDTTCLVTKLVQDEQGNIWCQIFYNNELQIGVARIEDNNKYVWYNEPFRRMKDFGDVKAIFPNGKNGVWFGGNDQIVYYNPRIKPPKDAPFYALVRRVITTSDSVIFGGTDPMHYPIDGVAANVLSFKNKFLRFECACPGFDYEDANQFQFFLEGFDSDWTDWTDETKKDYTNIPHGDYRFWVRAKNIYGKESREDIFEFTILPPWYRTLWAYIIFVAIAGLGILGIIRIRVHQLQQKTERLEKIVAERTAEVVTQKEQLEIQAEKLKEMHKIKSRFFANISHEFRTPLTLILSPASEISSKISDLKIKNQIKIITRNARRLLNLVNQLLDLSRLEAGRMKLKAAPRNFSKFIKTIVASFSSHAEQRNITLKIHLENESIELYYDPDVIEKVFNNLLSNALKYTSDGGTVTTSVTIENSTYVKISIKDTGIGIPVDRIPYIFDRFYQVEESNTKEHAGTGIGLALTKELLEIHHGIISVTSQKGVGTEFIVKLPIGNAHLKEDEIVKLMPRMKEIERQEPLIATSHQIDEECDIITEIETQETVILIVEDNVELCQYIKQKLEFDYKIIEARDGREGIEKAIENIPDLIISDIMMPNRDGIQLCHTLKQDEKTDHIPIILLTARASQECKIEGLETGADAYLTKPFDTAELLVRVKNLIEQRKKLREKFSREVTLKPGDIAITSIDEQFLNRAKQVIEEHIADESFSVETFGKKVGYSRTQIHRKLKALTDQSASQFILSIRLHRAAELLKQNAGTVSEIAYMVGFNTPTYFASCFKKQFGCSPSEYDS